MIVIENEQNADKDVKEIISITNDLITQFNMKTHGKDMDIAIQSISLFMATFTVHVSASIPGDKLNTIDSIKQDILNAFDKSLKIVLSADKKLIS